MPSPFYIEPAGGDVLSGLSGLSSIVLRNREAKEEKAADEEAKKRQRDMMGATYRAYTSRDPAQWAAVVEQYPEAAQVAMQGMGAIEDWQKEDMGDFALKVLSNPSQALEMADERIAVGGAQGRNMADTQEIREMLASGNVEDAMKYAEMALISSDMDKWKAWREMSASSTKEGATDLGKLQQDLASGLITQDQYDTLAEQLLTPEEKEPRAAATELGKLRQDLDAGLITQAQYDEGIRAVEAGPTRAPTAAQSLASGYAQRTMNSNETLTDLGPEFTGLLSNAAGLVPQRLKSDERQKFDQATRDFINATLRRESGAAIAESEFENARIQYIPQPGDGEAVLEQKKRNRDTIQAALSAEAGPALQALRDQLPASTVTIMGKPYAVGSEVVNAQGQRGRVEADGSITVIE